ncbi:hypothetical protein Droror1_Dr00010212, partial [Drosera rotundifolia]
MLFEPSVPPLSSQLVCSLLERRPQQLEGDGLGYSDCSLDTGLSMVFHGYFSGFSYWRGSFRILVRNGRRASLLMVMAKPGKWS